jgi:thiamine pyrophosphate-dependent acetolactate synthase large subunit-like protein
MDMAMTAREALEVLACHRAEKAVVTTMTAAGIWPELSDTPLDFAFIPSAMGHGPGLALGLALGSGRGVICVHGDGGTLMNLGCLVTLANNPADVWLVILDNGLYEVTGGQKVAGAGRTDFAGMARAAGIGRVWRCETLEEWRSAAPEALAGDGPAVIVLSVEGRLGQKTPKPPRPMAEQIARLRAALAGG